MPSPRRTKEDYKCDAHPAHLPLPFKEVMADVLKVKPPEKEPKKES